MRGVRWWVLTLTAAAVGCGAEQDPGVDRTSRGRDPPLVATPPNVLRRCDEVTQEVVVPVRCPGRLPAGAPWHVEHRNFGADRCEYLMDLAAFSRQNEGPFHLLLGARCAPWDLRTAGGRWPRRVQRGDALRIVGAGPLSPDLSPRPAPNSLPERHRVVGRADVAGQRALMLRAPAYPAGGIHGGHLVAVWNQDRRGHMLSVHVPDRAAARRRERGWLLAAATSMGHAAPRRPPVGRIRRAQVAPVVGGRSTAFRLRSSLMEPWPDEDPSGDTYRVVVVGPRGRGCRSRSSLSFRPERGARVVIGRILPGRGWCQGRFRGRVQLRDGHPGGRLEIRRVAAFSFRVR